MNIKKYLSVAIVALACISTNTQAVINEKTNLVTANNNVIDNVEDVIMTVKQQSSVTVRFPQIIPTMALSKKYYANADLSRKNQGIDYLINIDSTKDCNGIHYCNIASVRAKSGAKPEMYLDKDSKNITYPVTLDHHIKGYFTPGHAMADYFSANIQWQENGVLYQITWDTTKDNIIKMANSAINVN